MIPTEARTLARKGGSESGNQMKEKATTFGKRELMDVQKKKEKKKIFPFGKVATSDLGAAEKRKRKEIEKYEMAERA